MTIVSMVGSTNYFRDAGVLRARAGDRLEARVREAGGSLAIAGTVTAQKTASQVPCGLVSAVRNRMSRVCAEAGAAVAPKTAVAATRTARKRRIASSMCKHARRASLPRLRLAALLRVHRIVVHG